MKTQKRPESASENRLSISIERCCKVIDRLKVFAVVLVAILYIALVSYAARFRKRISGHSPVKKAPKLSKDKKPATTSDADNKNEQNRKR